jgi:hypothetical protein
LKEEREREGEREGKRGGRGRGREGETHIAAAAFMASGVGGDMRASRGEEAHMSFVFFSSSRVDDFGTES